MQQQQTTTPLALFYSYAREDELMRAQLEKHLRMLRRQGLISEWHDREIVAGEDWSKQLNKHLETASVILLLVSVDFLVSDYCYDLEMQRALERHSRGEARVIPIILRPCEWHKAPFAALQALPRDGKPVTMWDNLDSAFLDIAQGIRKAINSPREP
jgi:TIR domain